MTILAQVPYWVIPRNEEDRRESVYDRAFVLALRWEPLAEYDRNGGGVPDELVEHGRRHLNRLMEGDAVSGDHVHRCMLYLIAAMKYYDEADPWEPYPGRNREAYNDLLGLYELLVLE